MTEKNVTSRHGLKVARLATKYCENDCELRENRRHVSAPSHVLSLCVIYRFANFQRFLEHSIAHENLTKSRILGNVSKCFAHPLARPSSHFFAHSQKALPQEEATRLHSFLPIFSIFTIPFHKKSFFLFVRRAKKKKSAR